MPFMTNCGDIILYLHNNPKGRPHLHATYRGQESIITLPDCNLRQGDLPVDKLRQVRAWVGTHRRELMADREELTTEQDLLRFKEVLREKGRLIYSPEQRPSFADEGPGVEFE
ncbi:MAG: DUF4160 domain-containing protein [Candidatus Electrothrix sp. AUS1_2]|nr:DUF4160 domain-containing protein [Candidatus Electrothrix sp. AUS1_2]